MMRIVQSYNGVIDKYPGVTRWMMALSAIYLRALGVHNVLYADDVGFSNLGPVVEYYPETHLLSVPKYVSSQCFAACKFLAMQNELLGAIHIDNDVLLKSQSVLDKIRSLSDCDVIAQGIERYIDRPYCNTLAIYTKAGYKFKVNVTHCTPVNTGLICFHNQELRDAYYKQYFDAVTYISRWLEDKNIVTAPDFIPEQSVLYSMCQDRYRIGEIIDKDSFDACCQQADEIGYAHFLGNSKHKQFDKIKQRVRELDSELYDKIARLP